MLIESMHTDKKIDVKGFSMFIGSTQQQSKLWIGSYAIPTSTKYGDLLWMKLDNSDHWEVALTRVTVNGTSINLTVSKEAIFDTGTSLTYLPLSEFQ